MIQEREEAIRAFKPEEYWEVKSHLNKQSSKKEKLLAQVVKEGKKNFRPGSKDSCNKALEVLRNQPYKVTDVEKNLVVLNLQLLILLQHYSKLLVIAYAMVSSVR